MTVEVDFSENQILAIRLISHGESAYSSMYFFRAYPMVPDRILFEQSTLGVRVTQAWTAGAPAPIVFAGGTASQEIIVNAVEDAISKAGANPDNLERQNVHRTTPLPGDRFVPGSHTVYVPADTWTYDANGNFSRLPRFTTNEEASAFAQSVQAGSAPHTDPSYIPRVVYNSSMPGTRRFQGAHAPTLAESTRPASAANTFGNAVATQLNRYMDLDPAVNPWYVPGERTAVGIWLTVNFGRNIFQLAEHGNGCGLGTAAGGSGARPYTADSIAPSRDGATYGVAALNLMGINGSSSSQALGGYWWIQVAHRTVNDRQSTLHITESAYAGATFSAMGIRWGVEEAMRRAGATNESIRTFTPRALGDSPFWREGRDEGLQLIPGRYYVDIPGFNSKLAVTLCRTAVRYIAIYDPATGNTMTHAANAAGATARAELASRGMVPASFGAEPASVMVWAHQGTRDNPGTDPDFTTSFRGRLLFAYAETVANGGRSLNAFDNVEPIPGEEAFSAAVISALQTVLSTYNYDNFPQVGRLGMEVVQSNVPNRYR
jgi:hypothetical protein